MTNTSLTITKVRRDGNPSSLPKAHIHEATIHTSNNTAMAQGDNVWRIVVKATSIQ